MALHGLDRATAPEPATAKAMLDAIHGSWWNVYIGGPRRHQAAATWTPERVQQHIAQGITRFLLTYVGRQVLPDRKPPIDDRHLLTSAQGKQDGEEACRIAERFGYGAGTPLCLDLEAGTFDRSERGSMAYTTGWCRAVRDRGFRPGVYSSPRALTRLAREEERPDWVWVAKWVGNKFNASADPHRVEDLADNLWGKPGQRVWQYGGKTKDGQPALVGGLEVDINVADDGCLARTSASAGLVPGGLSMAEAEAILKRMEQIYDALREGSATNINSMKHIRDHIGRLERQLDELKRDVAALKPPG
jgi:hypothetical protein